MPDGFLRNVINQNIFSGLQAPKGLVFTVFLIGSNHMNSTIANKCAWHGYRAIFSRKSIVIARGSARVSHLHAALKKQPLTLVLTAPDEYRLQFLARYAIIIVSSSTVTYICITEECASDKCAEIPAFFSRRCSTCSRTTKMSRTCGTTGKSDFHTRKATAADLAAVVFLSKRWIFCEF